MQEELGFEIQLDLPYDAALERVIQALKVEGFGVLTRIDVRSTLKEKLGEDFRPYMILGACNPPLAHRALTADPAAGLMLPCNITVEAGGQGGSIVRIANPQAMMMVGGLGENSQLAQIAGEARAKLERVSVSLLSN